MKVVMPVLHYPPVIGGLEIWSQNIAEGLASRAEIFVVTGKVTGQPGYEIKNGVKIYRTSLFPLKNLSYSSPVYIFSAFPFIFLKSLFLIRKEKINIIHCQGFLSSLLGFKLSFLTGIPYIVTVQRIERKSNPLKNFVYRKATFCIAASSAIKKNFEDIGVKNIEVIPNGIDLKKFESLERKPHDGFIVMTVARLEKVKGVEYLIESIGLINSKFQIPNSKLLIIGDGSERKNLKGLANKLGLKERVGFVGQILHEKITEYLAQADCFVLPSLKEGFGIAVLEAMAAGLPVIGTRVGGIPDIIEDGKTGILVEPKNPEAIAQAIYEIYSGKKFAKPDLEKYNWQNITEKVYKIYEKNCLR